MQEQLLEMAGQRALGEYLSEWGGKSYEEVIEALVDDHPDIIVWEVFDRYDRQNIADRIETLRDSFVEFARAASEPAGHEPKDPVERIKTGAASSLDGVDVVVGVSWKFAANASFSKEEAASLNEDQLRALLADSVDEMIANTRNTADAIELGEVLNLQVA